MAKEIKTLKFQTCSTTVTDITNTSILANDKSSGFNQIANAATAIPDAYKSDPLLKGKVTAAGTYGWQKYVLEEDATIEFMARGAVGGYATAPGFSIDPSTGVKSGKGNIGGRGAKLKGVGKFRKGTVFYMVVGVRGPGYYNTSSQTITGGGGGASVILIENANGAYTLSSINKKVDVLLVAGGGAGAGSPHSSTALSGGDASYNNGINTNGGTGYLASTGGAGLTGNGTPGSGSAVSYSILSGIPGSGSGLRMGGWTGGGASVQGGQGAGGAGYSGGKGGSASVAAQGGTSYINPDYITPTFRGYATLAEDGINPWYVSGAITFTISAGRDPQKCILAKDSEGYKYFDGNPLEGEATGTPDYTWKLLPTQSIPEVETYETYGKTEITNAGGLSGKVRFLVMSPEAEETIDIDGNLNGITLVQVTPYSTSDISLFKSFSVTGALNNLDVRFALSKNQGATWQTYSAGSWVDINIKDKEEFKTNGYPLNQITTIPIEDFNSYKPTTLNFAFSITQNGTNTSTILNNIKTVVDLVGSWRHYKESEATYEYISDTKLKITFLQGGNYKVNYLDSLNSESNNENE